MTIDKKKNVFVIDISGSMEGKVEKDLKGNIVSKATNRAADKVGGAIGGSVGSFVAGKAREETTKLAEVKNQLIPVIKGLPEDSYFNIITFSNDVDNWRDQLIPATSTNKNMAIMMIENLDSGGGTNLYGGLENSFLMAGAGAADTTLPLKVEAVFFLTDGEASTGKFTNSDRILTKTAEMNPAKRIVINTVGLGKNKDADFLRKLANQNGGSYIDK
jgi:Mg-chelatase subunit ChlD